MQGSHSGLVGYVHRALSLVNEVLGDLCVALLGNDMQRVPSRGGGFADLASSLNEKPRALQVVVRAREHEWGRPVEGAPHVQPVVGRALSQAIDDLVVALEARPEQDALKVFGGWDPKAQVSEEGLSKQGVCEL